MRKVFIALLIFSNICIFAEQNHSIVTDTVKTRNFPQAITMNNIGEIGSILEPAAEILVEQINFFGIMLTIIITLLSILAYIGVFRPINEKINDIKKSTKEKIKDIEKSLKERITTIDRILKEKIEDIDKSLNDKVKNQIIYGIDTELEKATNYAEKRIDNEVKKLKNDAYDRLFEYQNLVYMVNQKIKDESDEILEKDQLSDIEKLKEIINIQFKYNEITNNYLTKLVSDDFETIKQTIKALSDYHSVRSIITMHLSDLCQNGKFSLKQKEEIKKLLQKYYDYIC